MTARTVKHGIDQSVPTYRDLPDKGHAGTKIIQEDRLNSWLFDPERSVWCPYETVCMEYDVDADGGTVGFHNLSVELPNNTLVWDGVVHVVDALVGGAGATVAIKIESAAGDPEDTLLAGLLAAHGTVGLHDVIPDGTAANAIRTTIPRQPKLDIRVADLTSGKLYVFLRCFRTWDVGEESTSSSSRSGSSASSSSSSSVSESSLSSESPSSSSSTERSSESSTSPSSSSSTLVSTSSSSSSTMVSTSSSSSSTEHSSSSSSSSSTEGSTSSSSSSTSAILDYSSSSALQYSSSSSPSDYSSSSSPFAYSSSSTSD